MECTEFHTRLGNWLDRELDAALSERMVRHAAGCRACNAEAAQARLLRQALRDLPAAPAPRPDFAREALRAARVADRATQRTLREHDLRWAGLAAAIVVTVVLTIGLRTRTTTPATDANAWPGAPAETYALTAGQVQALRLRIEAPQDFEGVRFSVELPDRVFLAGQPGIRAMTWEGQLRKGENVLELPLVASAGAAGLVATRVSWGSFEQRLETSLVSVPAGSGGTLPGRPQSGA